MRNNLCDGKIRGKNLSQDCQKSHYKKQPLVRPAVPDWHGREEKKETIEPEGALEVSTSLDTGNASAPQHYDTQKDSEQVLQEGTEAKIEVSQFDNNKQRANSNILHGKPGLVPLEPSLLSPTTYDGNNKSELKKRT